MLKIKQAGVWLLLMIFVGVAIVVTLLFRDLPEAVLLDQQWLLNHEDLYVFVYQYEKIEAVANNLSQRDVLAVYKTKESSAENFFDGLNKQVTKEGWDFRSKYRDDPNGSWKTSPPVQYHKMVAGSPFSVSGDVIVLFDPESQLVTLIAHWR